MPMSHPSDSQEQGRRERRFLNARRHDLARAAQELYPPSWRVGGTPMLARPEWIPAAPVPLHQVTLSWHPGEHGRRLDGPVLDGPVLDGPVLDGTGPEAAAAADLAFGRGRYFEMINIGEAAAHEYAAAALADGGPDRPPAAEELPLRSLIGDPTDLRRRPVMPATCTMVLRADHVSGGAQMILHWRDPARVASGGGMYQVAPVGMFQPSHDAEWNEANDFSLWRSIVRELSEELLGSGEDYQSDTEPINYPPWPLYATLTNPPPP